MSINALLVGELRKKTGAGIMLCKSALSATEGDLSKAVSWLKARGNLSKVGDVSVSAREGLVGSRIGLGIAAVAEVNSVTDFVARSNEFMKLMDVILEKSIHYQDLESVLNAKHLDISIKEFIKHNTNLLGESLVLKRIKTLKSQGGVFGSYIHKDNGRGQGNISVVILIKDKKDTIPKVHEAKVKALADQIAMHIAAANPLAINVDGLDKALLDEEREIAKKHALSLGKTAKIVDKMVHGREKKFLSENLLLNQSFVGDDKIIISELLAKTSKELGLSLYVSDFIRFELGKN